MAVFKFYLNGTEVEEPMNWMDSKFEYRRDPDLPGLITTFIADVEFYGNAYEIIKTEFETGFGCGEILVKIEEQCTDGINRDGIIFLSEIDLDLYRCVAKCNIEDNTIYGKLSRLKDAKVQVNCGKTVNGSVLAPISDFPMPFRTVGSSLTPALAGALDPPFAKMFKSFRAAEVLQQILDYITDNGATIVSDFLGIGPGINVGTTAKFYTEKICGMILGWTGNLVVPGGDTVVQAVTSWTDIYGDPQSVTTTLAGPLDSNNVGNQIIVSVLWDGTVPGNEIDLVQGVNPRIIEGLNVGNADVVYVGQTMLRFRFFHNTDVSIKISSFPSNTLLYTSQDYYQIAGRKLEATIGSATIDVNGKYGGTNLYINYGGAFKPSPASPPQANDPRSNSVYMSFQDLYGSLSSLYNLSMYPYFDAGTQYVRIEQEDYFFPTTGSTIQIDSARLISKRKDSEFGISKLNYSQTNQNAWAYLQSEVSYISNDCTDNEASINTSLAFPQGGFSIDVELIDNETIYMVDWGGFAALSAAQPQLLWSAFTIPAPLPPNEYLGSVSYVSEFNSLTGPPYFGRFLTHTGSAVHPLVAKNYVIRTSNGLKIKGSIVDNTSSLHIKYLYSIEVPLTRNELNLILSDLPAPIVFNGITGWILNMAHDIKTGMTTFELLTE
jgi:hypothetical protein